MTEPRTCRPIIVHNFKRQSRIECSCGFVAIGIQKNARRSYYQHNDDCDPIPMPSQFYSGRDAGRKPSRDDLERLSERLRASAGTGVERPRTSFPDSRDARITRCTSCGVQKMTRQCPVPGCWTNLDMQHRKAVA